MIEVSSGGGCGGGVLSRAAAPTQPATARQLRQLPAPALHPGRRAWRRARSRPQRKVGDRRLRCRARRTSRLKEEGRLLCNVAPTRHRAPRRPHAPRRQLRDEVPSSRARRSQPAPHRLDAHSRTPRRRPAGGQHLALGARASSGADVKRNDRRTRRAASSTPPCRAPAPEDCSPRRTARAGRSAAAATARTRSIVLRAASRRRSHTPARRTRTRAGA